MATIHADMTVGQLVAEHPATARVLERFQIDYCCGGQRMLAEACREQHLDIHEVVREVEGALQPRADTDTNWLCEPLANLCDHIEQTHHEYLKSELPRLTELIANVVRAHAERHPELRQAQQVFAALRGELEPHLLKEERILFPRPSPVGTGRLAASVSVRQRGESDRRYATRTRHRRIGAQSVATANRGLYTALTTPVSLIARCWRPSACWKPICMSTFIRKTTFCSRGLSVWKPYKL